VIIVCRASFHNVSYAATFEGCLMNYSASKEGPLYFCVRCCSCFYPHLEGNLIRIADLFEPRPFEA